METIPELSEKLIINWTVEITVVDLAGSYFHACKKLHFTQILIT